MSVIDLKKHFNNIKKYSEFLSHSKCKTNIFYPNLKNDVFFKAVQQDLSPENKNIYTEKNEKLVQLKNEIINCGICPLKATRKNAIYGYGNNNPKILFISKSPKSDDDQKGLPMQDESGQILEKIIKNVLFINMDDIFITNLIRCKIPETAEGLTKSYIDSCKSYTFRLIDLINPGIICLLGNETFKTFLSNQIKKTDNIADFHGKIFYYKNIPVIPTFSIYALIKNDPKREKRQIVFEDMKKLKQLYDKFFRR